MQHGAVLSWLALTAAAAPPPPTTAPDRPAPSQRDASLDARSATRRAISLLIDEAKQVDDGALPRASADFAASFEHTVDRELLGREMIAPVDRDPLIDAYVRWQLTSFDPILPELEGRALQRLLERLPPLPENPRAERRVIVALERARQAGELSEADAARLGAELDELARAGALALQRARPGLDLRTWIDRQLVDRGAARIALALERLEAMVAAGWPVQQARGEVEARFTEDGPLLDDDDRRSITAAAQRLAGRRRVHIASAAIVEGALVLSYDEAAVDDFDVRRWLRALAGR